MIFNLFGNSGTQKTLGNGASILFTHITYRTRGIKHDLEAAHARRTGKSVKWLEKIIKTKVHYSNVNTIILITMHSTLQILNYVRFIFLKRILLVNENQQILLHQQKT